MDEIKVIINTRDEEEIITREYYYKGNLNISVTNLLEKINVEHDIRIKYSSSCLQGLCGSCAMLINGWPKLACKTFVNEEVMTKYYNKITLEPLSKFPIVEDLIVDRSQMFENLKKSGQWLEENAKINRDNINFEYEVSQCLMCGCCLEACPNYNGEDNYYGAILPVSSSKIIEQEKNSEKIDFLRTNYTEHFFKGCLKSLVCKDVCPINIPTQECISKMNKKSVWLIYQLLSKIF